MHRQAAGFSQSKLQLPLLSLSLRGWPRKQRGQEAKGANSSSESWLSKSCYFRAKARPVPRQPWPEEFQRVSSELGAWE